MIVQYGPINVALGSFDNDQFQRRKTRFDVMYIYIEF